MNKLIFLLLLLFPIFAFSQYNSWEGRGIAGNAKIRCLNIFVNIIYDIHPEYNDQFQNTEYWPPVSDTLMEGINNTAIPTYLLDWMDTVYVPGHTHGYCTRLYEESSFDSLQITGDFIVVNLRESTILSKYHAFKSWSIARGTLKIIGDIGFSTLFNHNTISDYDSDSDSKIDFANLFIRNITANYGDFNVGSGYAPFRDIISINGNNVHISDGTFQCIGDGYPIFDVKNVCTHEISHELFGDNDFHTSGGNHRYAGHSMCFLNVQGGFGLMGAANSGLVSCNGYERWRMHWKHPQAADYISAVNPKGFNSVKSDISIEDGNKTFILRDFVTYGDAIRIKLPYKDNETSSNQYIWLENHQVGQNNKLDFLQYSNTFDCRPEGAAGIYVYYQIGRDILSGDKYEVWDTCHRDNLKIIPAEGFYDYTLISYNYNLQCVSFDNHNYSLIRGAANPFCGAQDQECHLFPEESDNILYLRRELEPWRIIVDGENRDGISFLGDNYNAFSSHRKINMGTNPSTCNAKTYYSNEYWNETNDTVTIVGKISEFNTQTTYLSGLSIDMSPLNNGTFIVRIRWDDYNIENDAHWTGNIVLNDTAILSSGNTIELVQNKTVALPYRDKETGLFAHKTEFRSKSNSYFQIDSASTLRIAENSSMILENGSTFNLAKYGKLEIKAGSSLIANQGANFIVNGIVEVDSGAVLSLYDTVGFGKDARVIVRPGGKLIVDGGTLTSACANDMWQGIEIVGNSNIRQLSKYQGTIELKNGATIENAICAIRTGLKEDTDFATTGGIIIARNATFRNNARSIEINTYAGFSLAGTIADNAATFTNCNFVIDSNNHFSQNNVNFTEHVKLWDVKNVKFYGCDFSNEVKGGRGIYAEDAGITIDEKCSNYTTQTPYECGCPTNLTDSCSFKGFSTAISANTTGNQYAVRINRAYFDNNYQGVIINGNNFVTITRNNFVINSDLSNLRSNSGLVLNNCSGYKVEQNSFSGVVNPFAHTTIGITVNNSGTPNNTIYRNTFNNLNIGVRIYGNNGNENSGLQIACADFTNVANEISLAPNATMKTTENVTINNCVSTLCGSAPINPGTPSLSITPDETHKMCASTNGFSVSSGASESTAFDAYCEIIRALMSDSLLKLSTLQQWHTAAQTITDDYSLAETEFQMSSLTPDETQTMSAQTNGLSVSSGASENEAYQTFVSLKSALYTGNRINWYAATDAQITELEELAEQNDGRGSELAKGVLCFFFDICEDEIEDDEDDNLDNLTLKKSSPKTGGYESFFGNNTWEYAAAYDVWSYSKEYNPHLLGAQTLLHQYSIDHFVNIDGKKYYEGTNIHSPSPFIREDTINGRLYARFGNGWSDYDEEILICDMSLDVNDTFTLYFTNNLNNVYFLKMVVDSISYINSKKQIQLKATDYYYLGYVYTQPYFQNLNISLRFMEGVGASYGIAPYIMASYLQILLCLHKDDTLYYMTHPDLGCYQQYVGVPENPQPEFNVFPNPANNILHVSFLDINEIKGTIIVRDAVGRVCYQNHNVTQSDFTINVANYTNGVYFITFFDENNRSTTKKFVKM